MLVETPDYREQLVAPAFYAAVAAGDIVVTPAFRAFGHAAEVPGFRMQAIIMGALVPDSDAYPKDLEGHLLFSDYIGGNLFSVDSDNSADAQFLLDWPGERGPIHMAVGPDGLITYSDLATGEIGRLTIAETPEGGSSRLSIAPNEAVRLEGTGTSTAFVFTVTRSGVMDRAFSIGWSAAPAFEIGTSPAQAADFAGGILPSGTVSFAAGQSKATITVAIAADADNEANERFDVRLANPAPDGVSLAMANAGMVIFNDDDGLSALSIAADTGVALEGTGGATSYSFTVTRTGGLDQAVSAKWRAAGINESGTVPTDAADFAGGVLPGGTVSFIARQSKASITVAVVADTIGELNERFAVTLFNPSAGAAVSKASASAIILNDDINFEITPTSLAKAEGNAGGTAYAFTIKRTGVGTSASVAWTVAGSGGNPANAADFDGGVFPSGIASLTSGETSKTITVLVAGDTKVEPDEDFTVTLSNPTGIATITTGTALATIRGDETVIGIAPLAASGREGTGGNTPYSFTVSRSGGLSETQTVTWTTAGITGVGTLLANAADFAGAVFPGGVVTFAPGESTKVLTLDVVADSQREFNERFAVTLSAPSGTATLGTAQAPGLILNDDTSVALITPRVTVIEGDGIWTTMSFYVHRFGWLDDTTTVDWAVLPGGVSGTMPVSVDDFYDGALSMGGSVTFEPGMNVIDVVLAVGGDALPEFNESFRFVLSNPTGASLGRAEAFGLVMDDDRIFGTTGNDALTGGAVADLFLIGAGQDVITGGEGRDRFQFLPSALGPAAQNGFTFTDFAPAAGERLDLSRIDAIAGGVNDAFVFIGAAPFHNTAGELRWEDQGSFRLVQGDVNGDAIADLTLYLANVEPVQVGWFVL